ncbi:MAG TPA: pentapeptide repeat-containing protein, partial [Myxococcota bacterium]|nr:pentapeptide repeat-containing protein [Myxococcota bacterium]
PLVPMTQDELLALAARGEVARYCWIEAIDLPADAVLPETVQLDRCVVGAIRASGTSFRRLILTKSIVLGDTDLGQRFEGEANRSRTLPASSFDDLFLRDTVFVGRANLKAVVVRGGRAWFPFAVFESGADLRAADLRGRADLRFASFGADVSFRRARLGDTAWLGGARFRRALNFSGVTAERSVYFNSATFESGATFEECEWRRDATFEDATFQDGVVFANVRVDGWLNLSRARFFGPATVSRLQATDLDALGARFAGPARFDDATIRRRARFSLDRVTLDAAAEPAALLREYRLYQGDEDADEPLVTGHSYGVRGPDDLVARFESTVRFANTVFGGFTVFEGVTFGQPGQAGVASFYNAQLLGETHLERTTWHLVADFSTIFGYELALNDARFERGLILDDANVPGRVNLAGATFADAATVSFDVAEINAFEIDPEQVAGVGAPHRLFYSLCADGPVDHDDVRVQRLAAQGVTDDEDVRRACRASVSNELTLLRGSWSDANMTADADDAYWWLRHYENNQRVRSGSLVERAWGVLVGWLVFEVALGWGVELQNLSVTVVAIVLLWAALYRTLCRDVQIGFFGRETTIGELPFSSLAFISLACFLLADYGLDLESDDRRVRALIALENVIGVLMITFFVGAYTRLILA